MVEFLGGKATPAIGFAIGIERLLELIIQEDTKQEVLYIGAMDQEAIDVVFSLVNKKRKQNKVITDYKSRSFSKHLNNASKQDATKVALIGQNELKDKTIWVKDLNLQEEYTIKIEDF